MPTVTSSNGPITTTRDGSGADHVPRSGAAAAAQRRVRSTGSVRACRILQATWATDIGSHSRRSRSVIFQSQQHRSVQLPVDDHHRMGDRHNGQVVSTIGELCHTNPPAPRTSAPASAPSTPPPTTDRAMYPNGEGEAIRADANSSTQHSKGRRPRPRVHDSAVTTPPLLRRRGRTGPVVVDETGAGTSPMYSPTRLGGPT